MTSESETDATDALESLGASEHLSFDPASSKFPHVLSGIIRAPGCVGRWCSW